MNLNDITPLIITLDEEDNIERTLAALFWAQRIVVVDSGSTDATLELLRADRRVEVFSRAFDSFAAQCNFGLDQITSAYTLSLDADHVVSPELLGELTALDPGTAQAWRIPFRYCVYGEALRGSLLPPRVALFCTDAVTFENDGHAHHALAHGPVSPLRCALHHDDRKPLARWLAAQMRYAPQEIAKLHDTSFWQLNWPDRCRRFYLGPLLVLPYCLLFKGLILDGRHGLHYTLQRLFYEVLFALSQLDAHLARGSEPSPPR